MRGGFDVTIKLDGRSGWDGSDLWLRLKLQLRSDGIHDYSVEGHNAILSEPFSTTRSSLQFTAAVAQSMAEQQARDRVAAQARADAQARERNAASSAQVVAACFTNSTTAPIHFQYRDGDTKWQPTTVDAGRVLALSRPYDGSTVPLTIRYMGYREGEIYTYTIDEAFSPAQLPCSRAVQYQFASRGNNLQLLRMPN